MKLSEKAENIKSELASKPIKLGDLRKMAREIKTDHLLAMELWSTQQFYLRQLALLIMDKKELTKASIDRLVSDIDQHSENERLQLIDWFMANQLAKDPNTIALLNTWENSDLSLQRRVYWYYQARLRWTGKILPNSELLLEIIEKNIENVVPEVQWAMNFTAAQIGIFEEKYRQRCILLGEQTGLYQNEKVSKNCTPNYLPEFIAIQVAKLNQKSS